MEKIELEESLRNWKRTYEETMFELSEFGYTDMRAYILDLARSKIEELTTKLLEKDER